MDIKVPTVYGETTEMKCVIDVHAQRVEYKQASYTPREMLLIMNANYQGDQIAKAD